MVNVKESRHNDNGLRVARNTTAVFGVSMQVVQFQRLLEPARPVYITVGPFNVVKPPTCESDEESFDICYGYGDSIAETICRESAETSFEARLGGRDAVLNILWPFQSVGFKQAPLTPS